MILHVTLKHESPKNNYGLRLSNETLSAFSKHVFSTSSPKSNSIPVLFIGKKAVEKCRQMVSPRLGVKITG